MGQKVKPKDLAMTMGIPVGDLLLHYKEDRDIQGLKRSYLEVVAQRLDGIERWGSFVDILALIIFWIVLFPNMVDFVDTVTISVLWVVKNQEVDPVPTMLADVYYTVNVCHDKEKGTLRCCIPLLYQWSASHIYKDIYGIEAKGIHAWAQKLISLNERSILWYPKKNVKDIIINYIPDPTQMSIKEVDRLRATVVGLKKDKESLENNLYDMAYEKHQVSYDLEQRDKKMESQRWKKSWEMAKWKQQEMEGALESQIYGLEESLAESQVAVGRQLQLRAEVEKMLLNDWRRTYQELLNLREQVHLQAQDHEVLKAQVTQLEGEVQYLSDLVDVAKVIVQEQGDRAKA
ncbi:hypothetical protein KIW84_043444 [Lathyrus oleraceus]|uniref:DUF7745 domain-containing protein n=1 Tax=Pisum sativum TaxID=3888 RepID=A0A9D5AP44_PEA|nr:hypothetical protein KIW84_043444 [Pisum sativum]